MDAEPVEGIGSMETGDTEMEDMAGDVSDGGIESPMQQSPDSFNNNQNYRYCPYKPLK